MVVGWVRLPTADCKLHRFKIMDRINFDHYEALLNSIVIDSREVFKLVKKYINNEGSLNDGKLRHDCSNYEIIYKSAQYQELNKSYGDTLYDLLKSEVTRRINNEVLRQCKTVYRTHVNLTSTEISALQDLISSTQDELTRVQDRLVGAERQIDILQNDNNRINNRLSRAEDTIFDLSTSLESTQVELTDTKSTLAQAMSVIGGLQDITEQLTETCKQQQVQIKTLQQELSVTRQELSVTRQKLSEVESRLDSFFNFTMDDLAKAWDDAKHARDLKNRMVYSVTTSLGEITTQMSDNLTDAEVQSVLLESVIKTQGFTENQLLEVVMILDEVHHQYTDEDFVHVDHLIASCERIRDRLIKLRQTQLVH